MFGVSKDKRSRKSDKVAKKTKLNMLRYYYDSEEKEECRNGLTRIDVEFGDMIVDCEVRYFIDGYWVLAENCCHGLHLREVDILEAFVEGEDVRLTVDEWKELVKSSFERIALLLEEGYIAMNY